MKVIRGLYFYLLVLPLLVPILCLVVNKFFDGSLPTSLSLLLLLITFSGVIGGIPFLIVELAIFFTTRKKTEGDIRRALLLSPLGMIVVFPLFILAISFIPSMKMNISGPAEFMKAWAFLSGYSLIFGYAYVAIIFRDRPALSRIRLYRTAIVNSILMPSLSNRCPRKWRNLCQQHQEPQPSTFASLNMKFAQRKSVSRILLSMIPNGSRTRSRWNLDILRSSSLTSRVG